MSTNPVKELTNKQIEEFFEVGWTVIPNVFQPEEIQKMQKSFDKLAATSEKIKTTQVLDESYFVLGEDTKTSSVIIKRVVWAGGHAPFLLDIGRDKRILNPVAQLLGTKEFDHLLNQAHFKRPGDKVIFDWHQDIQHRDKGPGTWKDVNGRGSYVQTALTVDPMTAENGPLLFYPGSSKWGKVDFGTQEDYDFNPNQYLDKMPAGFDENKIVTVTAPAGSLLLFGPYTAHASFENKSNASRRVLINGYAYPGSNGRIYPGSGKGIKIKI
jgi:ectoine hydroxylase-related dioxygenase (phytanoyl-CoA dioxygenase family)